MIWSTNGDVILSIETHDRVLWLFSINWGHSVTLHNFREKLLIYGTGVCFIILEENYSNMEDRYFSFWSYWEDDLKKIVQFFGYKPGLRIMSSCPRLFFGKLKLYASVIPVIRCCSNDFTLFVTVSENFFTFTSVNLVE